MCNTCNEVFSIKITLFLIFLKVVKLAAGMLKSIVFVSILPLKVKRVRYVYFLIGSNRYNDTSTQFFLVVGILEKGIRFIVSVPLIRFPTTFSTFPNWDTNEVFYFVTRKRRDW